MDDILGGGAGLNHSFTYNKDANSKKESILSKAKRMHTCSIDSYAGQKITQVVQNKCP